MKITLTEEQYQLIRDALENYYYICKADGEYRYLLDDIIELGDMLIKQIQQK